MEKMNFRDITVLVVILACLYEEHVVLAQTTCTSSTPAAVGAACTCQNASSPVSSTSYLYCTNSKWVTVNCLSGSTYDSTSGTCVSTVSTTPSTTTTTSSTGNSSGNGTAVSCTSSNNGATFPYQSSNTQFYVCVNGQAVLAQCAYNSIYNQATGSCTTNNNNNNFNPGYVSCPYGNILLPAPNGCQNYISCVNGQGTLKQCPMGLYFSPTMGACTMNMPPSCYNSGFNPGYYPNSNTNLGTNLGTNTFPIYQPSCYPNCNTNNNYNNGQINMPI